MLIAALLIAIVAVYLIQYRIYRDRTFDGIRYDVTLSADEVFEGEDIFLHEEIANASILPLPFVKVDTSLPDGLFYLLIDSEKKVIAAVAGDLEKAHEEGCALSRKLTQVPAVEADIAITSNGGYPLDQNVYQAVKGMTAAEACVKQGGAVIMCAALGDGAGGDEFYHWFADRENPQAVARDIEKIPPEETRMDQWEAQMLARVLCKASCYFVTEPENKEMIENMHMHWAPDVDTALAMARKQLGENATVTVIPDGVGVIVTPEA